MGYGDELMVTGQARRLQEQAGRRAKVIVRDRNGAVRTNEMWANNPRIAGRSENVHKPLEVINGSGLRPYIAGKSEERWTWREWDCPAGEIYFSDDERAFAERHAPGVILEPTVKDKASPNKDWGRARWQALADLLNARGIRPWQIGPGGTQVLTGVKLIETPSFRFGCAVLARAQAAVLPEGGLHHAAAALGVKSVVIFGGFIGPRVTGYKSQKNLFVEASGHPLGCGMRVPCEHCAAAMASITPQMVMGELLSLLESGSA